MPLDEQLLQLLLLQLPLHRRQLRVQPVRTLLGGPLVGAHFGALRGVRATRARLGAGDVGDEFGVALVLLTALGALGVEGGQLACVGVERALGVGNGRLEGAVEVLGKGVWL